MDPRTGRPCYSSSVRNYADAQTKSKKNSIVITNSNLTSTSQSESSLCRVEFQNDKISLALPPNMTWEEISTKSFSQREIDDLLRVTYQLNHQLRRKKKRMRNFRNDSVSMDQQSRPYPYTRSCPSMSIRNQSVRNFNYCESKPNPSSPSKNKIRPKASNTVANSKQNPIENRKKPENQESNVMEPVLSKVDQSSQATNSVTILESGKSVQKGDIDNKRKYSTDELFKLREPEITNSEIIETLQNYFTRNNCPLFVENSCKQKPNPIRSNNPSTSGNRSHGSKLPGLEELMQLSWVGSDDSGEAETSKLIYENLSNQVESFDAKTTESTKTSKKKKKKKPEKKVNQTEQIKTSEDTVEIFDDYYDDLTIQEGLKNGTMYQDILRINTKNWREAFVSCSLDNKDIYIDGMKNRNRALDGDEVVVELLPEKQTNVTNAADDNVQKVATQKCGKVVRIIKENHPRTAVGSLKHVYCKKTLNIFHCPIDARLPRIKITHSQCVPLVKLRTLKESVVYSAKITKWDSIKNAEGTLLEEIGDAEDPNVETKCILFENFLDVTPFESSSEFIPSLPYEIPADEISRRLDIRNRCVFTIDPPGAKDLDDALSCRILPNNNFEVGIHIADVTHFLVSDSPLDLNAREKATSVYLTETVYHMLPFDLCKLCSLTPGDDKLAFSVFVEFDEDANVISHSFSKTVLRSCVQLTYAHAQDVIDNYADSYKPDSFPPVMNGFSANDCVYNILLLQKLASIMRTRRFAGGALKIDKPKIVFKLDENRLPCSFSLYVGQECNWLIEEFMLLANILAANKILESFPKTALLRFHDSPKEKSLSTAVEFLEKVGIFIDITDAGSIYKSMMQYDGLDEIGMARMAVITNFLIKPMVKALYVCSAENTDRLKGFWHYALNTPYYTHFTSPIRRYADVVVHRLLAASLGYSEAPQLSSDEVQEIANNCNDKKNSSKKASETSAELYLKIYLERVGPIRVRAVVIVVKERHFELMDLTTRTVSRVQINKIKGVEKVEFENESMPSIKITWKNDPEPLEQIIQIFTIVDVELSFKKSSGQRLLNKIHAELLKPTT